MILRWEFDASLVYGILSAVRGLAVGPTTGLMVVTFLSTRDQGYYYCFRSLLGAVLAAELGIQSMLPPLLSHEWIHLKQDDLGTPQGEEARLARWISLCRASALYYLCFAPVLSCILFFIGSRTVSASAPTDLSWRLPWAVACGLCALEFGLRPVPIILEGSQKVTAVFRLRMWQGLLAALAGWAALAGGGGLWCLAASMGVGALMFLWPVWEFRRLLRPLLRRPIAPGVSWRKEVWPMQWRIGLSSLALNLATSSVIPIVFSRLGPEVAGQLGLSFAIGQLVTTVVVIWGQTRAPEIARLVATKHSGPLHLLLYRAVAFAFLSGILVSAAALLAQGLLFYLKLKLYYRLLPIGPTAILLAAAVFYHCTSPLAIYLRAHRYEPYLKTALIYSLALVTTTYFLTNAYGIIGAVSAQLVAALLVLPLNLAIWWSFRRRTYGVAVQGESGPHAQND